MGFHRKIKRSMYRQRTFLWWYEKLIMESIPSFMMIWTFQKKNPNLCIFAIKKRGWARLINTLCTSYAYDTVWHDDVMREKCILLAVLPWDNDETRWYGKANCARVYACATWLRRRHHCLRPIRNESIVAIIHPCGARIIFIYIFIYIYRYAVHPRDPLV